MGTGAHYDIRDITNTSHYVTTRQTPPETPTPIRHNTISTTYTPIILFSFFVLYNTHITTRITKSEKTKDRKHKTKAEKQKTSKREKTARENKRHRNEQRAHKRATKQKRSQTDKTERDQTS
jgi:predicted nucleotide-binding protein (sugar kinase/HSP70/actin superfamily)